MISTVIKLICLLAKKSTEYFSSNVCDKNRKEITFCNFYAKLPLEFLFYIYLRWSVEIIKI